MANKTYLQNFKKLDNGFVSYEVVDAGGNIIKCMRKDTIKNIKSFYRKYVDRVNAKESVDRKLRNQTRGAAQ